MTTFLFLIYILIGAAAGWGLQAYAGQTLPLSVGGGAIITLFLGQLHLLATRSKAKIDAVESKIAKVEKQTTDVDQRMKVVEARTDAIETTVKHELSERRDALVAEMRQLEGLIERLSQSFEGRLQQTETDRHAPAVQEDAVLRAVKSALKDGRVDLHLQPIVSLPQRRVAFYEGFSRLRDADGSLIMPAEFLDAARRSNLMGLIDNMTLFRCVQIVRKLAERDRRVGVFCNISASVLEDEEFFPNFLRYMEENRDLDGAMIFELRADRFETRSRKMRQNMDQLVALGFRFSIDHAPGLAIDLPRLQDAGVRFVKMNGNTLLNELLDPAGARPISSIQRRLEAEDVATVFSRYGVTLIAEKMEDEASVVEILAYAIPFGQGNIFGAPRPIKASLMEETTPPPAFIDRIANAS
jgi:cyclic-di-GMP phosphodiesterase TipF (flagellum assembly factor)